MSSAKAELMKYEEALEKFFQKYKNADNNKF